MRPLFLERGHREGKRRRRKKFKEKSKIKKKKMQKKAEKRVEIIFSSKVKMLGKYLINIISNILRTEKLILKWNHVYAAQCDHVSHNHIGL